MAIGMAIQDDACVIVKDENNCELFRRYGELHGYTGSTVTIKDGYCLVMYDEQGSEKGRNII